MWPGQAGSDSLGRRRRSLSFRGGAGRRLEFGLPVKARFPFRCPVLTLVSRADIELELPHDRAAIAARAERDRDRADMFESLEIAAQPWPHAW